MTLAELLALSKANVVSAPPTTRTLAELLAMAGSKPAPASVKAKFSSLEKPSSRSDHGKVMAFREKYIFGRKEKIAPDDLRVALQAIHDSFEDRSLFGEVFRDAALNDIWAEDLHIDLEWDEATGKLKALDPKEPYRPNEREPYQSFTVKDGRYVLPPEVRKVAEAIAAKQQAYRRGLAAERGLPMESIPYRILVSLDPLGASEAAALGFGGRHPDIGNGHIQYDASGMGETKWTKPLQLVGQEWIRTDPGSEDLSVLQRVVPRAQWSGPTFTKDEVSDIRSLSLPAEQQRWRVKKKLAPGTMSSSLLLPGQLLMAGGKSYVATNEVRTVTLSPFADSYYRGEWYEAQDGTVFGVVGFVAAFGDEPARKIGYGKGAKKIAVDRVYAIFPDDPTTARVHPVARGDRRIRSMKSLHLGAAQSQKKWNGLPVVSLQALMQIQNKTSGHIGHRRIVVG